jgi:hypothetical protein
MRVVETDERVGDGRPELITRFSWRALRRCRKLNEQRSVKFYRYEVQHVNGKWEVVAMQNVAYNS